MSCTNVLKLPHTIFSFCFSFSSWITTKAARDSNVITVVCRCNGSTSNYNALAYWHHTLCPGIKRPKCLIISPIKLKRYWRNVVHVHRFLNKIVAKWYKRFPPHLNNVSTLPCETWNAHCTRDTHHCYQLLLKETPEFIPLQRWSPNSPHLNPVDNSMWEILQETVYKTSITDLELSTTPLTNGCRNDDMIQLRSQSLFQFVQITGAYFLHLLLQVLTCYNQSDSNRANLEATVEVG